MMHFLESVLRVIVKMIEIKEETSADMERKSNIPQFQKKVPNKFFKVWDINENKCRI